MLNRILLPVTLAVAVIAAPADARGTTAAPHSNASSAKVKTVRHAARSAAPVAHARTVCTEDYVGGQAPAPVMTSAPPGRIFCHMIYSVSYSVAMLNPLWSAEHLTRADVKRGDSTYRVELSTFAPEPALTAAEQARDSEFDHNDWDKGHMTPANDAFDDPSQRDTFLLSNAVPQHYQLNRFLWAYLEGSVHQLAADTGEVYIVTGPIFAATPPLMSSRVPIPSATFKAVYIPSTRMAIGYIAENDGTPVCKVVPVAEIARQSGVDPFPALPAAVKAALPHLTLPHGIVIKRNGQRQTRPLPACA
jgi:endonuclease G